MKQVFEITIIWINLVTLIYISSKESKFSPKNKKKIVKFFLFFNIIFFSFRTMGMDLPNYERIYKTQTIASLMKQLNLDVLMQTQHEPLFLFFMLICKKMNLTFQMFLLIYYTIPCFLIYKLLINWSKNIITSLTIFEIIYIFQFDMVRHIFTIPIYIIALMKVFPMNILMSFIGVISHYSSAIIFPILLAAKTRLKSIKIGYFIVFFVLVLLIIDSMNDYNFIFLNNKVAEKFLIYIKSENISSPNILKNILLSSISWYSVISYLIYYITNNKIFQNTATIYFDFSIKVGIALSLALLLIFNVNRMATRVLFISTAPMFLCISKYYEDKPFTMTKLKTYLLLLGYPILISLYYVAGVL